MEFECVEDGCVVVSLFCDIYVNSAESYIRSERAFAQWKCNKCMIFEFILSHHYVDVRCCVKKGIIYMNTKELFLK